MPTKRDRILNHVQNHPGQTAREIAEGVFGIGTKQPPTYNKLMGLLRNNSVHRNSRDSDGKQGYYPGPPTNGSQIQPPIPMQATKLSWNPLLRTKLNRKDLRSVLEVLAKSTLWMPKNFIAHIQNCNKTQKEELLALHPNNGSSADLSTYFDARLAVGYPFARRLIASERKGLTSWLHRYHSDAGVILDDNRLPKSLWSYAWCGSKYSESENGPWRSHGFRDYEASHILPHKKENHEEFFRDLFEDDIKVNPRFLFLAAWNNLLVDRRVAGLTDNSPVVTAVLLNEIERRYRIDLEFLGKRRATVLEIEVEELAQDLKWQHESPDFRENWGLFGAERLDWLTTRLTNPKYRTKAPIGPET